eukprot:CAMPEP_0117427016 /NCGR_PEP_ID=MMETSP0758-20121206/6970_1 /TAXON_ID=63605 /ORGANISM="Percolomonas cosmopolitus, Strain AE-1 (ATCC 50343)" /LENGTH=124 /DNA_ID=CAMNT_0005212443 /DNA_START=119 /DNA_END=493 /DNA_ORIENTATION=+
MDMTTVTTCLIFPATVMDNGDVDRLATKFVQFKKNATIPVVNAMIMDDTGTSSNVFINRCVSPRTDAKSNKYTEDNGHIVAKNSIGCIPLYAVKYLFVNVTFIALKNMPTSSTPIAIHEKSTFP